MELNEKSEKNTQEVDEKFQNTNLYLKNLEMELRELQVLHKQSDRSESFTVPTHAHTGGACI